MTDSLDNHDKAKARETLQKEEVPVPLMTDREINGHNDKDTPCTPLKLNRGGPEIILRNVR